MLSFFDNFPTLDIASISRHPIHVVGRMVGGFLVFDDDPLSEIDRVEIFNAHDSKEKVVHQDFLMFCSWVLSVVIIHGYMIMNLRVSHLLRSSLVTFLVIFMYTLQ